MFSISILPFPPLLLALFFGRQHKAEDILKCGSSVGFTEIEGVLNCYSLEGFPPKVDGSGTRSRLAKACVKVETTTWTYGAASGTTVAAIVRSTDGQMGLAHPRNG